MSESFQTLILLLRWRLRSFAFDEVFKAVRVYLIEKMPVEQSQAHTA